MHGHTRWHLGYQSSPEGLTVSRCSARGSVLPTDDTLPQSSRLDRCGVPAA